jgi:ribonuclease R
LAKKKSPASIREADPHLERERAKYDNPLPSREYTLAILQTEGIPVSEARLCEILEIKPDEVPHFARRLSAMERDGTLVRNRRGALLVADKLDLIRGRVIGHPDGFGFLHPEDGSEDLFLHPKEMHKVLHGDIALVRETGVDQRGRREGGIVEVLEHAHRRIVGRLFVERGLLFVVAEDKRVNQDILVEPGHDISAKPGQVVVAEIVQQPSRTHEAIARIVEVLGNYADPGMEIEIALRKHDLPHEFPAAATALAESYGPEVRPDDLKGRKDLRQLPFVTIDGETAKDFDDAVYCEALRGGKGDTAKTGKGFRLYVAIADVSHYVRHGDALDGEARTRSTSVYFPRRVIPMLPEALSNGLCSLKPNVDRLVLTCEMEVSGGGVVKSYQFYPAVIHSQARLTYTRVAAFIDGRDADPPIDEPLHGPLEQLYAVFKALLGARAKRGAIEFESGETAMIFNDQGKIDRIVRVERNEAHKLIEECMLAANVCAAEYLANADHPALFRVHEGPTPERLENLRAVLKDFGLSLAGGDSPSAKDYAVLSGQIKDRPYASLLQTSMLRSMQQAIYSPDNKGHFGLAYEHYAHFTSPIRRYPDLVTHRSIKAVLASGRYEITNWVALGDVCSSNERRADEATRDVESWLKCYFMRDKVGEIYSGIVSGVTGFGLFVTLDEVATDGLVHISDLGEDYFRFDKVRHLLQGERTGASYRLGDKVWVKVVRVDMEQSKIDFVLTERPKRVEPDSAKAPAAGTATPRTAGKRSAVAPSGKASPAKDKAELLAELETLPTARKAKPKAAIEVIKNFRPPKKDPPA